MGGVHRPVEGWFGVSGWAGDVVGQAGGWRRGSRGVRRRAGWRPGRGGPRVARPVWVRRGALWARRRRGGPGSLYLN
jgi:hypothetical protein